MLVKCPKCSASFEAQGFASDDARVECSDCGESFQPSLAAVRSGWIGSTGFWIVLAVLIGVLFALAAFVVIKAGKRKLENVFASGQVELVKADLATFRAGLMIYKLQSGSFPSSEQGLGALVEKPTTGEIPRSWMRVLEKPLVDPWGNPYGYRYPATENKKGSPDVFSLGPDGVANTEDDIGNWE